jgi:hypothetical protein
MTREPRAGSNIGCAGQAHQTGRVSFEKRSRVRLFIPQSTETPTTKTGLADFDGLGDVK